MKIDPTTVNGWGIDADPENDPTYPMRKRERDDRGGYNWPRPAQQQDNTEILHSIERPNISATFGTSTPPSGLSGMIRRQAYQFSESSYARWLPLVLADRVDMIEGIVSDFASGSPPNIIKEKGLSVDWEHDKPSLLIKASVGAFFVGAAITLLTARAKRRRW